MPRFLKITLIALAAAAALLAAVAAYLVATFDPDRYKPLLVERVQRDHQRGVAADGRGLVDEERERAGVGAEVRHRGEGRALACPLRLFDELGSTA